LRDFFGADPFVMLNCDTIMGLDLPRMIAFHRERAPLATFALRDGGDDPYAYSRIEIDPDVRIRRMRLLRSHVRDDFDDYPAEIAPALAAALKPYMYCGAAVCDPAALQMLPKTPPFSLMGAVFAPMAARGLPLLGYVDKSFFRTVDDLASYESLRAEFAASPPRLEYLSS